LRGHACRTNRHHDEQARDCPSHVDLLSTDTLSAFRFTTDNIGPTSQSFP
jgi:hypothetical protein